MPAESAATDPPRTWSNGWTGGQYSVLRASIGAAGTLVVAVVLVAGTPHSPGWVASALLAAIAVAGTISVAVGSGQRMSALAACLATGSLLAFSPVGLHPALRVVFWMLLLNLLLPPAPFGSRDARGRVDPDGGWRMPVPVFATSWLLLCCLSVFLGGWMVVRQLAPDGVLGLDTGLLAGLYLLVAALGFAPRSRPIAWIAALLAQIAALVLTDSVSASPELVALLPFTFDPGWIRPASRAARDTVLYDGTCGLCHASVRFLLAEDRGGTIRYAPLGGATADALVPTAERERLPDSLIVVMEDATLLVRSRAIRHLSARLGGIWRIASIVMGLVPVSLADLAYSGVARVRRRLAATPPDACPVLPPDLRARFGE